MKDKSLPQGAIVGIAIVAVLALIGVAFSMGLFGGGSAPVDAAKAVSAERLLDPDPPRTPKTGQ